MAEETRFRSFRARVMNPEKLRAALDSGNPKGEADILVAAYDIPDTNVAYGNEKRQIIDQGAFRTVLDGRDFVEHTLPIFVDHGDAHLNRGVASATKKIGYSDHLEETPEGLIMRVHYNLEKEVARDAFSDLGFDPNGTQFSFRWPADEEVYDGEDGFEHVKEFHGITEGSQVAFGAQSNTGLVGSVRAAALERPHETEVETTDEWDEQANLERLAEEGAVETYRAAFAWIEEEEDQEEPPKLRSQFRHLHHVVSEEGQPGAASLTACRQGISCLSSGEIEEAERTVVYEHLAKHIGDAGESVPGMPEVVERTAIKSHKTTTDAGTWNGSANRTNLKPADEVDYRLAFAWYDPMGGDANGDGYPDAKTDWKFIHHFVDAKGKVGAASTVACSSGVGVLNGSRRGTTIPKSDRAGVYAHLAKHLKDAGETPPALRSAEEAEAALRNIISSEFMDAWKDLEPAIKQTVKDTIFRAPSSTAVSLDTLPQEVRGAFSEQYSGNYDSATGTTIEGPFGKWPWVDEVYADGGSADAASGYVIVCSDGDYQAVPWNVGEDPAGGGRTITFDEQNAQEVRKDWVPVRFSGDPKAQRHEIAALRSGPGLGALGEMLISDREFAESVKPLVDEALAQDPMVSLYDRLFGISDTVEAAS